MKRLAGVGVLVAAAGLVMAGCPPTAHPVLPDSAGGACVAARLDAALACQVYRTRPEVEACQAASWAVHECVDAGAVAVDGGVQ